MRTTLDLDETVLAVARSKARTEKISLGRAVSELALEGLSSRSQRTGVVAGQGFPVIAGKPGHVLGDALVEQLRDDE